MVAAGSTPLPFQHDIETTPTLDRSSPLNDPTMKQYFRDTHTAFYSIIAAIPLLIAYEILLALTRSPYWQVRNAADFWIRTFLMAFEITSQQATFAMIGILFLLIPFVKPKEVSLKGKYFGWMIVESFIYSLFLGTLVGLILHHFFLAAPAGSGSLRSLALYP